MRHNLRASVLLLTALSLVAAGLVTAPQAHAGPADEVIYADPADQLRVLDLATHDDNALPGAKLATSPYRSSVTSVSRDGSEVAWLSDDGTFGSDCWVYDRTTHAVRQIYHVTDGSAGFPVWMPDGRLLLRIVNGPQDGLLGLLAPNGTVTTVPGTKGAASWDVSPSGDLIVFSRDDPAGRPMLHVVATDGTGSMSLGVAGRAPSWRHDGARIAFVADLSGPDGKAAGSVVETVTPQGLKATLLATTYSAARIEWARWSLDDASLMLVGSTVATVPATATVPPTTVLTGDAAAGGAAYAGAWTSPDTTAPVLTNDPTLSLRDTGVRFTLPAYLTGYDVTGVRVAVSPGLTAPATFASGAKRVSALGRVFTADVTGLVPGATYSYSMWSFDASGNQSLPRTGHFRLVPATLSLTAPAIASANTPGDWIRLSYATGARGAVGVSVKASWIDADGGGGGFASSDAGVPLGLSGTYTYGRNGYPITLMPGSTYTMRGGTRDTWGNVHWGTATARVQYPYDDRDRHVTYAGAWSRAATTGTWLGTTSMTRAGGSATLRIPKRGGLAARHFSVVATTAPGGGRFKVYLDGRYVTTVSTASSSIRVRRTVWTSSTLTSASHILRVVQVPGSGWVRLDAVAIGLG